MDAAPPTPRYAYVADAAGSAGQTLDPPRLPDAAGDVRRPLDTAGDIRRSVDAAGDIRPTDAREVELCDRASRPDWIYLAGLGLLDVGAIALGSSYHVKFSGNVVSLTGPAMIGLTWGATLGGGYLSLPKCEPGWVGSSPPEGDAREVGPLAIALAVLGGITAPVIYGIAINIYALPADWSDFDRVVHVALAGVSGFGGALLPYLLPPRTWTAARELRHLRASATASGGWWVGYAGEF